MKIKIILLTLICSFCSCSNSDNSPIVEKQEDNYYVKYEVYMEFANSIHTMTISYVDEKGNNTITSIDRRWDGTFGPIDKKTKLSLRVKGDAPTSSQVESYVRLSVSKNKEPFVLKGEQREASAKELFSEYTIDF